MKVNEPASGVIETANKLVKPRNGDGVPVTEDLMMFPRMTQAIPCALSGSKQGSPLPSLALGDGELLNGFGESAGVGGLNFRASCSSASAE